MEGAGEKGGRGAHELKSTGKYKDECVPGLVRFQLCLALGLRNITHPQNPIRGISVLYDSLIIEVSSSQSRARLISIGFAIYCFINNLHPAHASPFSF